MQNKRGFRNYIWRCIFLKYFNVLISKNTKTKCMSYTCFWNFLSIPNSNRCLICAEDHDYKNCPNKSKQDQSILKCVNCSGNHSACSKICPVMKEKTKELETKNVKKNPTTSKSYSRIVSEPTSEVRDLNQKIDELLNVVINLIKLLTTHCK